VLCFQKNVDLKSYLMLVKDPEICDVLFVLWVWTRPAYWFTSTWPHLKCDVRLDSGGRGILTELSLCYSIVLCTVIMVRCGISSYYNKWPCSSTTKCHVNLFVYYNNNNNNISRSIGSGFALARFSSLSSDCFCISLFRVPLSFSAVTLLVGSCYL